MKASELCIEVVKKRDNLPLTEVTQEIRSSFNDDESRLKGSNYNMN